MLRNIEGPSLSGAWWCPTGHGHHPWSPWPSHHAPHLCVMVIIVRNQMQANEPKALQTIRQLDYPWNMNGNEIAQGAVSCVTTGLVNLLSQPAIWKHVCGFRVSFPAFSHPCLLRLRLNLDAGRTGHKQRGDERRWDGSVVRMEHPPLITWGIRLEHDKKMGLTHENENVINYPVVRREPRS